MITKRRDSERLIVEMKSQKPKEKNNNTFNVLCEFYNERIFRMFPYSNVEESWKTLHVTKCYLNEMLASSATHWASTRSWRIIQIKINENYISCLQLYNVQARKLCANKRFFLAAHINIINLTWWIVILR